MTPDTSKQDEEIRRTLGIGDDVNISPGIHRFMRSSKVNYPVEVLQNVGISQQSFREYSNLLMQGMQWVYEQHPDVHGVMDVIFNMPGNTVNIHTPHGVLALNFNNNMELTASDEHPEFAFIKVPWNKVAEYQQVSAQDKRTGQEATSRYTAKARSHIGPTTLKETAFLVGVEEAYHAVQWQDPVINARLKEAERKLQDPFADNVITIGMNYSPTTNSTEPLEYHDREPRELDVVPVLEKALAAFRARQQRQLP